MLLSVGGAALFSGGQFWCSFCAAHCCSAQCVFFVWHRWTRIFCEMGSSFLTEHSILSALWKIRSLTQRLPPPQSSIPVCYRITDPSVSEAFSFALLYGHGSCLAIRYSIRTANYLWPALYKAPPVASHHTDSVQNCLCTRNLLVVLVYAALVLAWLVQSPLSYWLVWLGLNVWFSL